MANANHSSNRDQEEWRDIPGWESSYQSSSHGRIRSLPRKVIRKDGQTSTVRGKILTNSTTSSGYKQVTLRANGNRSTPLVHRLVLEAFYGQCPEGMEACHNNGDPSDNRLSNLRWDTRSGNIFDQVRHGTHHWFAKTHCPSGHEYTPDNTYLYRNNYRQCRKCKREAKKRGW